MKKFRFSVTRVETAQMEIEIEANSEAEAKEKVIFQDFNDDEMIEEFIGVLSVDYMDPVLIKS